MSAAGGKSGSRGVSGGKQLTLDRSRSGPPSGNQPRYGSLFRSIKVLKNTEDTKRKYSAHPSDTSGSFAEACSSKSSTQDGGGTKSLSFASKFRPLGQPLKVTVTGNADGKEAPRGFGIAAFAPPAKTIQSARSEGPRAASVPANETKRKSASSDRSVSERPLKRPMTTPADPSGVSGDSERENGSSSNPPPVPAFSTRSAAELRALTSKAGLRDLSNPITHSSMYTRTQHYVSSSTGHQQSNRGGGSLDNGESWMKARARKLQDQADDRVSDLFKGITVYINGYTGSSITNKELIRQLHINGALVLYNPSGKVTHTISTMPLSGKKTQEQLNRKQLNRGSKLVTPAWALDSIAKGARQPEHKYTVFESKVQGDLKSLFAKKS